MSTCRPFRIIAPFAIFIALCLTAGCAKTVEFQLAQPSTQYFELERSVTISLFNMSFGANEVMKYRQDIKSVSDERIEMDLTPLELTVVRSDGGGTNKIYGSKLLAQPNENPEVTVIRQLGGRQIHLRVKPGGEVDSMSVAMEENAKSALSPFMRGKMLNKVLRNIFVNSHLMMTQSILPKGQVRMGKPYRPAGKVFEKDSGVDENIKLMLVESIDEAGIATLSVDPRAIKAIFKDSYSALELAKDLPEDVEIGGEGLGRFLYDMNRRLITNGEVALSAKAKVEGRKDLPVAPSFSMRVDLKLKEIPAM